MIRALRRDPEIQRRYQLWVFSYPTGYPYPYSAALLRTNSTASHAHSQIESQSFSSVTAWAE